MDRFLAHDCGGLISMPYRGTTATNFSISTFVGGRAVVYAIMEKNDPYVRVIEGSVSNVIGLPMETLTRVMEWINNPLART